VDRWTGGQEGLSGSYTAAYTHPVNPDIFTRQ